MNNCYFILVPIITSNTMVNKKYNNLICASFTGVHYCTVSDKMNNAE